MMLIQHLILVSAVTPFCGNTTGAARLACLRDLSLDSFMNISYSIGESYANVDDSAMIDGIWVTNSSVAAARNGQLNRIHFMAGSMPEEGESYVFACSSEYGL